MMATDERVLVLDKTDFAILSTLAKDCRTSYNSIGSHIDLTSKSVKARVKKMIHHGVIEKFVVRVNPAVFGLEVALVLIKTSNGITKDDVIQRVKHFGDLAYHVHHMGRTCVAAIIIEKPFDDITIQSLSDHLKPSIVVSITVSKLQVVPINLSETDLRIIKCLVFTNARAEISEIAMEVGISEKTATRRLAKMKEADILDFSIQCSPSVMIGYIQFAIRITTAKFHHRSTLERMYAEFQSNILYSPSVIDPEDRLTFVLFSENVFTIDSIFARISSFEGVKSADVYILTKWQFHDEWIAKEIDKRIPRRQPLLYGSN
jgi:DNA-binding Lrp family transcriptional regulator